jgi:hypothetical protein
VENGRINSNHFGREQDLKIKCVHILPPQKINEYMKTQKKWKGQFYFRTGLKPLEEKVI